MALGDKAAAKGMAVVPSTNKLNEGDDEMNRTRDYLADEMDARTTGDAARVLTDLFKVQQADPGHKEGRVWMGWL